ncbi:MAG: hypothetical protein JEZ08_04850 [Clostridiales bacterium]|nr:hypothetical protein [Clostridiales bacterium]
MRKKIIIFILLATLIGCQSKVTTFNEVIKDGKVEMDGIEYDIRSVTELTNEYDRNDNLIRRDSKYDDTEQYTEFVYDGDLLIEEKRFSSHQDSTVLYHYDEYDREIKIEYVYKIGTLTTEFKYDGTTKRLISKNMDGSIQQVQEAIIDDQSNILSFKSYDADGNLHATSENTYVNNKLVSSVSIDSEGKKVTNYYEYNNFGDRIFWYTIHHLDEPIMMAHFFEYVYNKDSLPISVKIHRVQSIIEKDEIRDYWE